MNVRERILVEFLTVYKNKSMAPVDRLEETIREKAEDKYLLRGFYLPTKHDGKGQPFETDVVNSISRANMASIFLFEKAYCKVETMFHSSEAILSRGRPTPKNLTVYIRGVLDQIRNEGYFLSAVVPSWRKDTFTHNLKPTVKSFPMFIAQRFERYELNNFGAYEVEKFNLVKNDLNGFELEGFDEALRRFTHRRPSMCLVGAHSFASLWKDGENSEVYCIFQEQKEIEMIHEVFDVQIKISKEGSFRKKYLLHHEEWIEQIQLIANENPGLKLSAVIDCPVQRTKVETNVKVVFTRPLTQQEITEKQRLDTLPVAQPALKYEG
eukprot:augustus_masked-scaffold_10-processed-gene-4.3-mRNA-1 protein AED:1.00 eAED:1.00 QI:0/-1/0/0/-1/1/1/0/323